MDDVEVPEIVILNEAALDVEELEARLEIAVATPNADCWTDCSWNCLVLVCD